VKHNLGTFPLLTVLCGGSLRMIFMSVSDFSLQSTNTSQIRPPNSLCDQLVVWYWPVGNNQHSEFRPWPMTAFGDCMGAMEANNSIRGTAVSSHYIQNFREVVYNENSKWGHTEARLSAGVGHNLRGQHPGTPCTSWRWPCMVKTCKRGSRI
jgi:hypothetical protein